MEEESSKKWEEGRASRANGRAFNFKNSVGGWIGAFVQSLVWLIRFEWRVFIGVSELATVLRSRHVQFKSTRESYLALGRVQPQKKFFFLTDYPPFLRDWSYMERDGSSKYKSVAQGMF